MDIDIFKAISNDVVLEIFEYLDGKSLKNCSEVCKRFNSNSILFNQKKCLILLKLFFLKLERVNLNKVINYEKVAFAYKKSKGFTRK